MLPCAHDFNFVNRYTKNRKLINFIILWLLLNNMHVDLFSTIKCSHLSLQVKVIDKMRNGKLFIFNFGFLQY